MLLIINDWSAFHPSLDLLNPERISNLFTHGPFICESALFPDLMYFTTLRVLDSPDNKIYNKSDNFYAELFAISIRQSMCITHLSNRLSCRYSLRKKLLLLKSLCYSLFEVAKLVPENLKFLQSVESFNRMLLICIQQKSMIKFYADENFHKIFYAINKSAKALVDEAIIILSKYIEDNILVKFNKNENDLKKPIDIINYFSNMAFFNEEMLLESVRQEYILVANRWKRFHENVKNGYLRSGSLWKGAEYLFMQKNPYTHLGKKIWLRRLVKKTNFLFTKV